MDIDLKAVLLQMRITHIMQTSNLIDQVNTLFNLEDMLKQKEDEERSRRKPARKRTQQQQHHPEFAL